MNKFLLTTALLTLGSFSANAAIPASINTLSDADFSTMQETVATTSVAIGLHTGDFQATARTAGTELYKGEGSFLMGTVRRSRY